MPLERFSSVVARTFDTGLAHRRTLLLSSTLVLLLLLGCWLSVLAPASVLMGPPPWDLVARTVHPIVWLTVLVYLAGQARPASAAMPPQSVPQASPRGTGGHDRTSTIPYTAASPDDASADWTR